jgi:O-glycosyl hydrolase
MSCWSAPGYLKVSRQPAGSKNGIQLPETQNTLKKINGLYVYDQYAHWWLRSLQKYASKGIRPDDISIQNEPDMNCGYECTILKPTQNDSIAGYAQALKAVSDILSKVSPRPNIFGPEVLGITNRNYYGPWEENVSMFVTRLDASLLSGYNYHFYDQGYNDPDGCISWVQGIANQFPGKPIVMSEFCNLNGTPGSAPDMLSGARIILNGFIYRQLSGYIYWDLIWGDGGNMVNVNNPWNSGSWKTPNGFQVNPEYHDMRHFSKFVSPGWSRVAASSNDVNIKVVAFSNPAEDSLTVVAINISSSTVTFNAAPSGYSPCKVFQSQVSGPMSANISVASGQTAFSLPASSITTIVFTGAGTVCSPTTITPYVQINGGTWQQNIASATVDPGATVVFGPQPTTGGSWSWSGPNGYSASTREITISNISSSLAGNYVAIYTNPSGCKSTQTFSLTVNGSQPNVNPYIQNEAEAMTGQSGVQTESCSEGGLAVAFIENGDWIKAGSVDFGSGAVSFDARVASATSGGKIEIRLDNTTGTLVGTCAVPATGGWQTWVTKSCAVSGISGVHDLYLVFTGGSGYLFNLNWWKFFAGSTTVYSGTLAIHARGNCGSEQMQLLINNSVVKTWNNVGTRLTDFIYSFTNMPVSNDVKVQFTNDAIVKKRDRALFVDYIKIGSSILQAENQPTNTGFWTGTTCGGVASEWLNCNGYIDFSNANFSLGTTSSLGQSFNTGQTVDINQTGSSLLLHKEFTINQTTQGLLLCRQGYKGNSEVRICNLNGASIYKGLISGSSLAIPKIQKGMYIVNIKQDKILLTRKFLVK